MTFESEQIDREISDEQAAEINKPWINSALEKVRDLFKSRSIDMNDFRGDLAFHLDVDKDIETIRQHEKNQEVDDATVIAEIAEGIVLKEAGVWLGSDVKALKASEYDDLFNRADIIIEFTREGKVLRLAVDVTFGGNQIPDKIAANKEEFDKRSLGGIKYCESMVNKAMNVMKRYSLKDVPHAVVALETKTVLDLSAALASGKDDEMDNHISQYSILKQLQVQFEAYANYCEKIGYEDGANKYNEMLEIINNRREENKAPRYDDSWRKDRVLKRIELELQNQFEDSESLAA